ncbi:glutathione S-transferase family protein [Komagataeibacter medellinensis]|uniref:Glutathione S-transferase n=2 Tax=Komagataeibacter medellinensis TaxID=1177712 RepID=G2I1N2_KOMMN|nr:glutathione S-transferase family protein [Komagataeibacter medellinensis]KAB8123576.1 glutathione S-transferase family protein [Komagataeibacter medellinensis]BAK84818.1 glutathione S-transferase [Komagataeibacter medellinensis NBRC 3288]
MSDGMLVIGTRRYSSWSLRGWLAVRLAGLDVREQMIPLADNGQTTAIATLSPNGKVPYLEHNGIAVWESLALCEYCAEHVPGLWPADARARAYARSIASEMHAGFRALRQAMPMNTGRDNRALAGGTTPDIDADITRIDAIWTEARLDFGKGGDFLFGARFGMADAMFAPIVSRLLSYGITPPSPQSQAYMAAVRAHPLVAQWYEQAAQEPADWRLSRFEDIA